MVRVAADTARGNGMRTRIPLDRDPGYRAEYPGDGCVPRDDRPVRGGDGTVGIHIPRSARGTLHLAVVIHIKAAGIHLDPVDETNPGEPLFDDRLGSPKRVIRVPGPEHLFSSGDIRERHRRLHTSQGITLGRRDLFTGFEPIYHVFHPRLGKEKTPLRIHGRFRVPNLAVSDRNESDRYREGNEEQEQHRHERCLPRSRGSTKFQAPNSKLFWILAIEMYWGLGIWNWK